MTRPLVLLAFVLVAAACEQRTSAVPRAKVALERCRLPGVSAQASCGTVEVFEDRAARSGRKLALHVAVVPALGSAPKPDPLFILAGGPGQGASEVAGVVMAAFDRVRRTRDIVFLDQRGTGKSAKLECDFEAPDAGLAERMTPDFDVSRVKDCVEELSKEHDLRFYGTSIAMEDLDEVRAALGYEKINLWGASYGTRAALVYMRQHPDRVRTAILDGVAPLSLVLPADMAADADRALGLLFEHCSKDAGCARAYPDLRARFDGLLAQLGQTPARVTVEDPVTGVPTEIAITREAFVRMLRALLYQPEATTLVPLTIDRASRGDFRPFVAQTDLVTSGFAKGLAMGMFFSVVCTEDVPFLDPAQVDEAAKGTFVGPGFADEILQSCQHWPKGPLVEGFRDPVRVDTPVLLFSGTLDPVTPPRWAEAAHQHLPNSVHVEVPATGHGTLGNACVRKLVEQFLERGTVQGLEARCDEGSRPPFFTDFAGPPP